MSVGHMDEQIAVALGHDQRRREEFRPRSLFDRGERVRRLGIRRRVDPHRAQDGAQGRGGHLDSLPEERPVFRRDSPRRGERRQGGRRPVLGCRGVADHVPLGSGSSCQRGVPVDHARTAAPADSAAFVDLGRRRPASVLAGRVPHRAAGGLLDRVRHGQRRESRCVYGCCGRPSTSAPVPSSTSSPLCSTAIRCGEQVDDREVVADEQGREAELAPAARRTARARAPAPTRPARCVGSSAISSFGPSASARARLGALPLPAGELVREPVAERLRQLHGLEQLVDPPRAVGASAAGCARSSGSATHSAIVSSGLKLVAGSWKTNPIRLRSGRNVALLDAEHLGARAPAATRR